MMVPTHLPGAAWLKWLKNLPLRIGVLTGIYLTAVMTAGLLTANRLPELEAFADLRNWTCSSMFLLVALIPVATFRRRPWSLFTSAASGWLVFSLAYWFAGIYFEHLHTRLNKTPFHVFLLGLGSYAVIAVAIWVGTMTREVLQHGIAHPHHHRSGAARPNE
ncbi:MAG TPA: hypothetical protein VKG84_00545 [Candidatus Acidoferrales bacterium]|nr:hypothetical protein [Candidatus Acidoferrales bacterium]